VAAARLAGIVSENRRTPPSLTDLDRRLKEARARIPEARRETGGGGRDVGRAGMAAGFRIAVELLAALVVGGGIGWLLDRWLGTQPWLLILFFILGAAAGFVNVYRTGKELDRAAKAQRAARAAERVRDRGGS
jgi:ATP synthase protein I